MGFHAPHIFQLKSFTIGTSHMHVKETSQVNRFSKNGLYIAEFIEQSNKLINSNSWNDNMDLQKMLKQVGISIFCDHDTIDQMLEQWIMMNEKKKRISTKAH